MRLYFCLGRPARDESGVPFFFYGDVPSASLILFIPIIYWDVQSSSGHRDVQSGRPVSLTGFSLSWLSIGTSAQPHLKIEAFEQDVPPRCFISRGTSWKVWYHFRIVVTFPNMWSDKILLISPGVGTSSFSQNISRLCPEAGLVRFLLLAILFRYCTRRFHYYSFLPHSGQYLGLYSPPLRPELINKWHLPCGSS